MHKIVITQEMWRSNVENCFCWSLKVSVSIPVQGSSLHVASRHWSLRWPACRTHAKGKISPCVRQQYTVVISATTTTSHACTIARVASHVKKISTAKNDLGEIFLTAPLSQENRLCMFSLSLPTSVFHHSFIEYVLMLKNILFCYLKILFYYLNIKLVKFRAKTISIETSWKANWIFYLLSRFFPLLSHFWSIKKHFFMKAWIMNIEKSVRCSGYEYVVVLLLLL